MIFCSSFSSRFIVPNFKYHLLIIVWFSYELCYSYLLFIKIYINESQNSEWRSIFFYFRSRSEYHRRSCRVFFGPKPKPQWCIFCFHLFYILLCIPEIVEYRNKNAHAKLLVKIWDIDISVKNRYYILEHL